DDQRRGGERRARRGGVAVPQEVRLPGGPAADRGAPLLLVAEHAVRQHRAARAEREARDAGEAREGDRVIVARFERGLGRDAALDIDAEGEDPDLAVPALEEGARDGTFVALEEEEPAAPPRVAEGVRGDLGEELAVAPAGVRHVEPAPEGFALRRVRRHADRQTEPAGAADVVLPRRPT